MTHKVSPELLAQFSDFLAAKIGLSFPPKSWPELARGMKAAARDLGCGCADSCMREIMLTPMTRPQIEILASHLTVGETYFFREKRSLAVLENHILPELIKDRRQRGRRLRLWSAGCASGEEAYTLAILLSRTIPDLKDWQVHLLATDINPLALEKANRGLYGKWSFRDTPTEIREQYFLHQERHWEILPSLKQMVSFAYLNLAEDPYPSLVNQTNAMDLIFCRNVLLYFSQAQARKVLQKLAQSLVEGGWLIVSLTETSLAHSIPLVTVNFPEAMVYRKDSRRAGAIERVGIQGEPQAACPALPHLVNLAETKAERLEEPSGFQPAGALPPEAVPLAAPEPAPVFGLEVGETAKTGESATPARVEDMVACARKWADQGDLAAALNWCDQAVTADRLNPAWHYLRAAILQEQNAVADAVLALRKALYLDREFVMAHFALGNLALQQSNPRDARKHFDNALALLSGHQQDEQLPEGEGITAGRLKEIVLSTMAMRKLSERNANIG